MNVACLVPYPLDIAPSQRFRVEQWAKPLAAIGVKVDYIPFLTQDTMQFLYKPGHLLEKSRDMVAAMLERARWSVREARDYDVVVIHREAVLLGLDWIERYLARSVPTVFDFDDAIWLPKVSANNQRWGFTKSFDKINRILGMVTSVSAGCEYLAQQARRFNGDVHIVPTSINLDQYGAPREHASADVLHVGWTGSLTSAVFLVDILPALEKAAKKVNMRLTFLGGRDIKVPGVDVECIDWTPTNEVPTIRSFDVGVKPVTREEWSLGKCPMKDIQYMALGIPCVATKFGTSMESITHGDNGFLCDTDEDWTTALAALTDLDTRRRMGEAGRRVVEQRYSSVVAAKAFAGAIESAYDRFHRKSARAS